MKSFFANQTVDLLESGFYFLHIPKTAGTTFGAILKNTFPPEKICPAHHLQELAKIPACKLGDYRVFRGHFYYGIEKILGFKPIYGTFLREPVARYISNFRHIQRTPDHPDRHLTLKQFVSDPHIRARSANYQTRSLVAEIQLSMSVSELEPRYILQTLEKSVPQPGPREKLELARERLKSFAFVGVAEEFQSSLLQFAESFRLKCPETYPILNTVSEEQKNLDISNEVLKIVQDLNQFDFELYNFARALFQERVQKRQAVVSKKLNTFAAAFSWRNKPGHKKP